MNAALEALGRLLARIPTEVQQADGQASADYATVRAALTEGEAFADLVRSTFTSCCEEGCNAMATWRSGVYPWVCDAHIEEWRASDAKAASKGSPNPPFVEVEEVHIVRALNRLTATWPGGAPRRRCTNCGDTENDADPAKSCPNHPTSDHGEHHFIDVDESGLASLGGRA